jgi:hypothetical protein
MKPLKLINLFDSIPQNNNYSHYGSSLEKMFKMSSLKYLIKTLKFKKEFHKKYLKEETVNNQKKEYDIYEMEKIKTKKNEENQEDIFSLPSPLPKSVKERTNQVINKSYFYHKKSSSTLNDSPDSLKYNPNFNSISKNIPSVKIVKPSFDKGDIDKNEFLNQKIKKDISKIILKTIDSNKNLNTIDYENVHNNSKNNINIIRNDSNDSLGKARRFMTEIPINNSKIFSKNNSCKKYPYKLPSIITDYHPHYMSPIKIHRKRKIKEINNNTISFYNKNKAVDFRKMQSRSSKVFLNIHSLKVPNFGYYKPNYDFVEKRQFNILLDRPTIDVHKRKKLLLKKIIASYYIEPDYKLIDNKKLNDDALKTMN